MAACRLQRWALQLAAYDFIIEYIKSSENGNADGLSRLPLNHKEKKKSGFSEVSYVNFIQHGCVPVSCKDIRRETEKDPVLKKILKLVQLGWPSKITQEFHKPFFVRRQEITIEQGCLLWGHRVIVPSILREEVLSELHKSHLGIVKMKSLARSFFWWPTIDKDIGQVVNTCRYCLEERSMPPRTVGQNWNWPEEPWERIHADFFGPILGKMFIIVIDAYSKFIEVVPMHSTTSEDTIRILREIFARFGLPKRLVTDNGAQWTSKEFACFIKKNGIKHTTSAPYHPSTNGAAENAVKFCKKRIKIAAKNREDVHTALVRFLFDYRNTPHCTTCETPSKLMFGRVLRTRFDLLKPDSREKVKEKMEQQWGNYKGRKEIYFELGSFVLVKDYRKAKSSWVRARVVQHITPVTYMVEVEPGLIWKRHVDQILQLDTQEKNIEEKEKISGTVIKLSDMELVEATKKMDENSTLTKESSANTQMMVGESNSEIVVCVEKENGDILCNEKGIEEKEFTVDARRYPLRERKRKKILDL